jgi:hypothetical protein
MRKNGGTECVRFVTHTCLIQKCPNDLLISEPSFKPGGQLRNLKLRLEWAPSGFYARGMISPGWSPGGRFLKIIFKRL